MDLQLIGERIKCLREDLDITVSDMAKLCEMSEEDYLLCEEGKVDYSYSFLNRCATRFGVDISELLTGSNSSNLKLYAVEKKGHGLRVDRREGFDYYHLASKFAHHKVDPLCVHVPYCEDALNKPIVTNVHKGQEFDYILEGTLKVAVGDKTEVLDEGDSIIYDSSTPHGMIALSEGGCKFLAIVIK